MRNGKVAVVRQLLDAGATAEEGALLQAVPGGTVQSARSRTWRGLLPKAAEVRRKVAPVSRPCGASREVQRGDLVLAQLLLDAGARVDAGKGVRHEGRRPLTQEKLGKGAKRLHLKCKVSQ